jgi:16S rRNA C967 or C1407 C5-methylase (RsmB/RsmF family)
MCAAPGSKTGQMLEKIEEGCIIANEMDPKRV